MRDTGPNQDQGGQRLGLAYRSRIAHARASVANGGISVLITGAAAGTSRFNKLSNLVVSNVNATGGKLFLRDGTQGSNMYAIGVLAGDTVSIPFAGFFTQTTAERNLVIGGTLGDYDVIAEFCQEI